MICLCLCGFWWYDDEMGMMREIICDVDVYRGLVYCVCLDIHNSKSILDVERKEVHHSCNPSPLFRGGGC